jgi:hypothetical protein
MAIVDQDTAHPHSNMPELDLQPLRQVPRDLGNTIFVRRRREEVPADHNFSRWCDIDARHLRIGVNQTGEDIGTCLLEGYTSPLHSLQVQLCSG